MLKNIFYIAEEEICNKCWNQLAQAIKEVKNNNPQEINNLMFFKYYLKDQITALVSKVITIIKCNNNFRNFTFIGNNLYTFIIFENYN